MVQCPAARRGKECHSAAFRVAKEANLKTKFSLISDGTVVPFAKKPTSVPYPYRTVILGEEHIVKAWQEGNLLTDKGEFIFQRLQGKQVDSEWAGVFPGGVPSSYPIQSMKLLEVATIQPDGNGGWYLNGQHFAKLQFLPASIRLNGVANSEVLRVYKDEIRAVAWVQAVSCGSLTLQLDTVLSDWKLARQCNKANLNDVLPDSFYRNLFAGWSKPVWLTEFHGVNKNPWLAGISKVFDLKPEPISLGDMLEKGINPFLAGLENIPMQPKDAIIETLNPRKGQARRLRQQKAVARFENDYKAAVIPSKKNGKELNLSLELELQTLVKEIISAGGKLSRKDAIQKFITKHGKTNSENYQPEKLLRSKIAKALIKAGLLGTDKVRTTTFWAKERAD